MTGKMGRWPSVRCRGGALAWACAAAYALGAAPAPLQAQGPTQAQAQAASAGASQAPATQRPLRAILLPVGGDAAEVAAHGERALAATRQALERASIEVLEGNAGCGEPACAPEAMRALDADLAAGVALWSGTPPRAVLVLLDREGREVGGEAEGEAEAAVRDAFDTALARWSVRAGTPVRVTGSPEGATITVDRALWGTIPHEGALLPGPHVFAVSAAGYVTERRQVSVLGGEPLDLRFDLAREARGAGASVALLAAGAGIALAGLVMGAVGLYGLGLGTSCDERGGCVAPLVDASIGWSVGGAATLALGAALVIVGAL